MHSPPKKSNNAGYIKLRLRKTRKANGKSHLPLAADPRQHPAVGPRQHPAAGHPAAGPRRHPAARPRGHLDAEPASPHPGSAVAAAQETAGHFRTQRRRKKRVTHNRSSFESDQRSRIPPRNAPPKR